MKHRVQNRYLITLGNAAGKITPEKADQVLGNKGSRRGIVQTEFVRLISAEMNEQAALALTHHPLVVSVEEVGRTFLSANDDVPAEPRWHLDRIDQRSKLLDATSYSYSQMPDGVHKSQVKVYVFDSGVWKSHTQFAPGQVADGINFSGDDTGVDDAVSFGSELYPTGNDPSGKLRYGTAQYLSENAAHGTAVAALIGGATYGVFPGVRIIL